MPTTTDARPALDDVLDELRGLLPDIAARARQTAADGHVPRVTFDELTDIGVFRLMQPARFGGYEYGPTALAGRLRTGKRLRLDRLVRCARRVLWVDDLVLPPRSAAGGVG